MPAKSLALRILNDFCTSVIDELYIRSYVSVHVHLIINKNTFIFLLSTYLHFYVYFLTLLDLKQYLTTSAIVWTGQEH